jgi:IS30 family transposase
MTLVERMDIFRLLYVEKRKSSAIATALNRRPSGITRELEKGVDQGMYNPIVAEAGRLESRQNHRPRLKMTDEAWTYSQAPTGKKMVSGRSCQMA